MQIDLNLIESWCTKNKLTLNIKKTKIMTYMSSHKRKTYKPFKLYMKGLLLDEVESYKYLGTLVDNKLCGESQHTHLAKSLGFKLKMFGKIRRFLTTKAAMMVYKSTILPIIDYNDHFQLLWNADQVQKLQKFQNWGLRSLF